MKAHRHEIVPMVRGAAPRAMSHFTDAENQWLVDLHVARPDLGWRDLARRFFREFGKNRSSKSVQRLIGERNGRQFQGRP